MRAGITISALLLLLVSILGCGGGEEAGQAEQATTETTPADMEAISAAYGLEDAAEREAAFSAFLADFPESEYRRSALSGLWKLKSEADGDAAAAWARATLATEPSANGKGELYKVLFDQAAGKEDREAALVLAKEFWDSGLEASNALNAVAWNLVEESGWDPELGAQMAERAAKTAEPGIYKAMALDTAGWGNFKLGRYDLASLHLETAMEELAEPDGDLAHHLEEVYLAMGEEPKLLALYSLQLEFRVDSRLQTKAETMVAKTGRDVEAYRAGLWERRLTRATDAPDFTLADLDGVSHRLSDYRGKVLMINFWHPT